MSLPHALLTALVEQPGSGSELATRFDRSMGYPWHATHQQIYRELARLETAKLIEMLPEQPGRGRKRACRILPAGREALRRWIMEEGAPSDLRDEFLVRVRAAAAIGPEGLEDEIRRRIALHQMRLAQYRAAEQRDFPQEPADREGALQHLVLRVGMRYESNWLDVLHAVQTALEKPPRAAKVRPAKGSATPAPARGAARPRKARVSTSRGAAGPRA